jgi:subtilase family serine protease
MVILMSVAALALGLLAAAPAQAATHPASSAVVSAVKVKAACGAATAGHKTCFALRRTDVTEPVGVKTAGVSPAATPSGINPGNLQSAYKLPSSTGGSGQTVAIVDAFNDPNAAADLAVYRSQYGLPACTVASGCFRQVNQNGATSPLPTNDSGWAGEISLDVDMVSAVCPNCKIILVEANSASDADLYAAEDRAVTLGAKFVSNSWGGSEYSGQTTDDAHFNHPGVAITVSSGDNGNGAEYPATSRYVTAVGGTHLTTSSNSRGWTESAWSGAGSGCSAYDAKPSWQTVTTNCSRRAEADVSAVADPATGVAVYQTYGASGWVVYGGTSVASPIVASVYALAGTPAAGSYPVSLAYSHTSSLFDVTSGSNGSCGSPICTAGTGWDGPTGLGTPNGIGAF